ncbi:MAG: hypothetical protein ACP5OR_08580 [Candidatus Dormibacteria bacterium]
MAVILLVVIIVTGVILLVKLRANNLSVAASNSAQELEAFALANNMQYAASGDVLRQELQNSASPSSYQENLNTEWIGNVIRGTWQNRDLVIYESVPKFGRTATPAIIVRMPVHRADQCIFLQPLSNGILLLFHGKPGPFIQSSSKFHKMSKDATTNFIPGQYVYTDDDAAATQMLPGLRNILPMPANTAVLLANNFLSLTSPTLSSTAALPSLLNFSVSLATIFDPA